MLDDQQRARRVGGATLVALVAAIVFFVFIADHLELGTPTRIRVYFASTAGLRERAPFIVGGQAIGHIESVDNVPHGQTTLLGDTVGTVMTIAIDEGEAWKVPASGEVFVSSRGLLSERYLEVAPPRGAPGPAIIEGTSLRGIDPPSLDRVMTRTWAQMTIYKAFVEDVGPEITALRTQLAELRAQLGALATDIASLRPPTSGVGPLTEEMAALVAEMRTAYEEGLGGGDGLLHVAATITRARTAVTELRAAIDMLSPLAGALVTNATRIRGHLAATTPEAKLRAVLETAKTSLAKLGPMLAVLDDIAGRIARHEGSIGRLMNDPEFPEDAKELGKIMKRHPWRILLKP